MHDDNQPWASQALAQYDLPPASTATLINLSENATYRIDAPDGRRWALRLHRAGYHPRDAIRSELAWATELRAAGAAITPRPVPGRDGQLIQNLPGDVSRHAVVFDWEEGREPLMSDDLADPFKRLGEITARLHLHSRQWQRPPWFTRFIWDFETSLGEQAPHWGRWRDGPGVDAPRAALFQRTVDVIAKRLQVYGQDSARFGLIHADLRLANLLIDGDAVKLLDFDDMGFGWFMYDAATPVSFHEHEPQVPALIDAWKEGYRRVAALAKVHEAEIETFIMLRRLLLVAWIGSHAETPLAKDMGRPYTEGTDGLCEEFLTLRG